MLEDIDVGVRTEAQTGEGGQVGTFDLCARCPSHSNCCSRVRHGGEIEAPLLRGHEVQAIERETGKSASEFSEQRSRADSIRWMRTGDGGCYFFRNGKCGIYATRPIDCRLFPYDVRENEEGQLVLIAYTSLCPETFDVARYRAHALSLLDLLGDDILAYGQVLMPGMNAKPYVTLGTIDDILTGAVI